MMKNKILFVLVCLATIASCGCDKKRELPPVDPVEIPRYSTGLSMSSTLLNRVVKYDILLPEGYNDNPDKRYPVMYCFHGWGDSNTSWNGTYMSCEATIKSLERKGLEPMIYVFPNAWKTYWVDRFDGSFPYMTMLVEEFIPMIDRTYRTLADREHRGTIGYSMGGFGSMAVAMKHPELFSMSAPLSMSFRTDEQYMAESQSGWDNQWGINFGGVGESGEGRLTDYYKSLCPLHQFTAENYDKYSSVYWFLTCGDNEKQLLIANDDLHVMMRRNGYAHQYRVGDGGHSTSYWKAALTEILPYFSALMAGETSWQFADKEVDVPEGCEFTEDGAFLSEAYTAAGKQGGMALFIAYEGVEPALIKDAMAILQRGVSKVKRFVLLPCDLDSKTLPEWMSYYQDIYPTDDMQVFAIGNAGKPAFQSQGSFSALYFEDALLPEVLNVNTQKFYYIGQSDEATNYASANALYKACKLDGASFEYRCRNHLNDVRQDFLYGIELLKSNLHNF